MTADDSSKEITAFETRLAELDRERASLLTALEQVKQRRSVDEPAAPVQREESYVARTTRLSNAEKIAQFRSLFRGRDDVFPRRWENSKTGKAGYAPACRNEWVRGICEKPRIKCGDCPNQAFIPATDEVVRSHLLGRDVSNPGLPGSFVAGIYPLMADETCWFLAVDFDKQSWQRDALAFLKTCGEKDVPAALERSRSGNGGHVWIFFSEPVPATEARKLGAHLVTETMERHPDLGFESYDRFFPSQDTMPVGGFGNLIALPLQNRPRQVGNSVFVDDTFRPYDNQWAFLKDLRRMSRLEVANLVDQAKVVGRILGLRVPLDSDDDEPWLAPPKRRKSEQLLLGTLPQFIEVVLANQVYIDRSGLPPTLVNRLIRLAAFQNPEFYAAQAMRLPTFGKPRVISCAELFSKHIALPRGCLDAALDLLNSNDIKTQLRDERFVGKPLEVQFLGTLTTEQQAAAEALVAHDTGVLAATTAFGKTVVACRLIAQRKTNTLVLVHRQQLLEQWIARMRVFLDLTAHHVGMIRGRRKKPTGIVDVATIQSLVRKREVSDLVEEYGHLVIDECHHLSAVSFEAVARAAKAKYVLGLSATVTRKDGRHPIIFMHCGPVRYRVDARKQANRRPFLHRVVVKKTSFRAERQSSDITRSIQELYALLGRDGVRNDLIFDDILTALEAGRSPVVITERKEHLQILAGRLRKFAKNVIVLKGGMGVKQRHQATASLASIPDSEERVIVATGRYLGEGFDDARLDTLFLTMPISWRGTLAQYAGRLHRLHATKREVVIYDYVDADEPVLAKMASRREVGYRALGYDVTHEGDLVIGKTG
jgi:superfamily II DNA or RNA helicase